MRVLLTVALLLSFTSSSEACSRLQKEDIDIGFTLPYPQLTVFSMLTILVTSFSVGTESEKTNRTGPTVGLGLGYFLGCMGSVPNRFKDASAPENKERYIKTYDDPVERQKMRDKALRDLKKANYMALVVGAGVNIANASFSRVKTNQIISKVSAGLILGYFLLDPNKVLHTKLPTKLENASVSPMIFQNQGEEGFGLAAGWKF